jgi:hypothetical protein
MCWTVPGDEDFRQSLDEMCMSLNELADARARPSRSPSTTPSSTMKTRPEGESRDDFVMLFVGPTPAAIMQVQRDLLVQDVVNLMERHFDGAELGGVVGRDRQAVQPAFRCAGQFAGNRQATAGPRRIRAWRWQPRAAWRFVSS